MDMFQQLRSIQWDVSGLDHLRYDPVAWYSLVTLGACIGLFILFLFIRFLGGSRGAVEHAPIVPRTDPAVFNEVTQSNVAISAISAIYELAPTHANNEPEPSADVSVEPKLSSSTQQSVHQQPVQVIEQVLAPDVLIAKLQQQLSVQSSALLRQGERLFVLEQALSQINQRIDEGLCLNLARPDRVDG